MHHDFEGQTVVVLGSGPSLTAHDIELVRRSKHFTVAVNTTWKSARFCDVIYAADYVWWNEYRNEIDIAAEQWTCSERAVDEFGILRHNIRGSTGYNSGLRAVQWAVGFNASRIILLGFDLSIENGTHHHGDHDKTGNPDEDRCSLWIKQFQQMDVRNSKIINCSRESKMTRFKKVPLESVL